MKKRVRKITAILLAVSMVSGVSGCGKSQKSTQDSGDTAKVKIAYQYGLAYAPLTIMQEQGLIEKNYDGDIEVEWVSLNSGSAINEGMASGDIDVACMGITVHYRCNGRDSLNVLNDCSTAKRAADKRGYDPFVKRYHR